MAKMSPLQLGRRPLLSFLAPSIAPGYSVRTLALDRWVPGRTHARSETCSREFCTSSRPRYADSAPSKFTNGTSSSAASRASAGNGTSTSAGRPDDASRAFREWRANRKRVSLEPGLKQTSSSSPAASPSSTPSTTPNSTPAPDPISPFKDIYERVMRGAENRGAAAADVNKVYASQIRSGAIAKSMDFPAGQSVLDAMRPVRPEPASPRSVRTRPEVGRMVELDPQRNIDFPAALRMMNSVMSANRVRLTLSAQRTHERPGLRRKRLRRQRWRKQFHEGFFATMQRVHQMRRQGW